MINYIRHAPLYFWINLLLMGTHFLIFLFTFYLGMYIDDIVAELLVIALLIMVFKDLTLIFKIIVSLHKLIKNNIVLEKSVKSLNKKLNEYFNENL